MNEDVMYLLISIFAILSETVFIYIMFKNSKKIITKKKRLLFGILISYIFSGVLISFNYHLQIWFLLIWNTLLYVSVKILYKQKINILDFLLFGYILSLFGLPCSIAAYLRKIKVISYMTAFVISRIIMLSILLLSYRYANKIYRKITMLWNRRDDGTIKAITVRNIILIGINLILYALNIIFSIML